MKLPHTHTLEAIGTPWSIETDVVLDAKTIAVIGDIIENFDQAYSRFRADSIVSYARDVASGTFAFPASIVPLYDTYTQLERATNGAVNPLVGEALEHWGYDAAYSLRPAQSVGNKVPSLADTIIRNGSALTYKQPALLDIGAIGKGLLIDMVAEYLAKKCTQYVVEAGGDMRIKTDMPYTIGLEHPVNLGEVIGTIELEDKSICGSSPNRRAWGEGLHHIIDARTGKPSDSDIIATWAIADTAMLADALSTALFFAEPARLRAEFGDFQHLVMKKDFRIVHNMTSATA